MELKQNQKSLEHLAKYPKSKKYVWMEKDGELHIFFMCSRTKEYRPLEDFYEDKRKNNGLYSYCREVANDYMMKIYNEKKSLVKQETLN